jgi:hypothetical protein
VSIEEHGGHRTTVPASGSDDGVYIVRRGSCRHIPNQEASELTERHGWKPVSLADDDEDGDDGDEDEGEDDDE